MANTSILAAFERMWQHTKTEIQSCVSDFRDNIGDYIAAHWGNHIKKGSGTNSIILANDSDRDGASATGNHALAAQVGHANGAYATALGVHTYANAGQFVCGYYNNEVAGSSSIYGTNSTSASLLMVGNGIEADTNSNAFRVRADGKCYGQATFGATGADFAEMFEYVDGNPNNEDRRGLMAAMVGDKIKLAQADDDVIGIISALPTVIGDVADDAWQGKYLKDVFGDFLTETVEIPESINAKTGETIPAQTITKFVVNPDYDPNAEYVSREFRPEWSAVGLVGKVVAVDDGTCEVGKYCKPSVNGVATLSEEKTKFFVMKRIDETHIRVLVGV